MERILQRRSLPLAIAAVIFSVLYLLSIRTSKVRTESTPHESERVQSKPISDATVSPSISSDSAKALDDASKTPVEVKERHNPYNPARIPPPDAYQVLNLGREFVRLQETEAAALARIKEAAHGDNDLRLLIEYQQSRLKVPLRGITWGQAFDNPALRTMLMSMLRDPGFFVEFRNGITMTEAQFGFTLSYDQATTPEVLVAELRANELHYQNRFSELAEKYRIDDSLAQALAEQKTSADLRDLITRYMNTFGFRYDAGKKAFVNQFRTPTGEPNPSKP